MIIGILGKKGSGKDVVGRMLLSLDPTFAKIAFADPVREAVSKIMKIDMKDMDSFKRSWLEGEFSKLNDQYSIECRHIYREIGMLMISVDEYCLILDVADKLIGARNHAVVTDVRMDKEVEFLINRHARFIIVEREGIESTDNHITEKVPEVDSPYVVTINNDGSIDDLRCKVEQVYKEFLCSSTSQATNRNQ